MARVTTKTGLANLAASHLKTDAVASIDPPDNTSKFAKAANKWYDEARRQTLRAHVWNCALKRAQPAEDATAPAFGYSTRYLLPADFIRVATIGDEDNPETDYKIEGGYLLCNLTSPINLRYVYDLEDITLFDPLLIDAFALRLAQKCCYEVTGSRTLVAEINDLYDDALSIARTIDGQDSPPTHKIRRSRWNDARQGRSLGYTPYQGRVVT